MCRVFKCLLALQMLYFVLPIMHCTVRDNTAQGTILSSLQSYLSSRNFVVNVNATSSAPFPLH